VTFIPSTQLFVIMTIAGVNALSMRGTPSVPRVQQVQLLGSSVMTLVEECILAAESEDDVQSCLSLDDDRPNNSPPDVLSSLEVCILAAGSEDEVQECMTIHDDTQEEGSSLAHKTTPEDRLSSLEVCILGAGSEDEVQACLQASDVAADEAAGVDDGSISALEECILDASSEDEVQECLQMSEMAADDSHILPLGECLRRAEGNQASIDECVIASDQSLEPTYG